MWTHGPQCVFSVRKAPRSAACDVLPAGLMKNLFTRSLGLALALLALVACGSRARFQIVRPAMFDASPYGNTFSVQPFAGVEPTAAYRAQTMIEQRVQTSLNPSIQLLAGGGGVIISGVLMDYSYSEGFNEQYETCYRTEYYRDGAGRQQSRQIPYSCVRVTRTGMAHSALRLIVSIAQTGQVVWDRTYEDSQQRSTSAVNGTPANIDGGGLLAAMMDAAVEEFSRVILPWPDSVTVSFSDCGHADGCDQAWDLVRANDLPGAEAIYTRILGPYDDANSTPSEDDLEIVADTLFNRGVVRAYSGSYELGLADIQRALSIRAEEDGWRSELSRIEALAAEQDQLRQQVQGAQPNQGVTAIDPAAQPTAAPAQ
jgi:hypothetical protein